MVWSTDYTPEYPARSVLILGERDEMLGDKYNYWSAQYQRKTGQGFTLKLDTCPRMIAGCQIKNTRQKNFPIGRTRKFRVSGSMNKTGPWNPLVKDELIDTRGKPAELLNFAFREPVEIQFLKFELVSFWGSHGGGLQYFAAIPAISK